MDDRIVEFPHRYRMVPVSGQPGVYDFMPVPGTITSAGTPLNKANLLSAAAQQLIGQSTVSGALSALKTSLNAVESTANANKTGLASHNARKDNPHSVTRAQIGAEGITQIGVLENRDPYTSAGRITTDEISTTDAKAVIFTVDWFNKCYACGVACGGTTEVSLPEVDADCWVSVTQTATKITVQRKVADLGSSVGDDDHRGTPLLWYVILRG